MARMDIRCRPAVLAGPRIIRHGFMTLALLALPAAAQAATLTIAETVMTDLANPRGMIVGSDGALYVAEAGSGGTAGAISNGDGFGSSGGISRYLAGVQDRFMSGLASLAASGGGRATGIHDLAFDSAGVLHAVFGLGADPAERSLLSGLPGAETLGTLVRFSSSGEIGIVADLAAHEASQNPDGGALDTNPFSLVATSGGFVATDAGGNAVLAIDAAGTVTTQAVLPTGPNPLPFGPPRYQAVPTGAALAPDGTVAIGQLTGFPFLPGAAQIYQLNGTNLSILAGGFTNLIDLAYGRDGTLYALELDSDGLRGPGTGGALYSIGIGGLKTLLIDNLADPTGLAIGRNGAIYVALNGNSPTDGSVVRLAPVPLPASLPALFAGLALLAWWRKPGSRSALHPAA